MQATIDFPGISDEPEADPTTLEERYRQAVIQEAMGEPEGEPLVREYLYQTSQTRLDHGRIVQMAAERYHAAQKIERGELARDKVNELRDQRRALLAECNAREAELRAELAEVMRPAQEWDREHQAELANLDAQANAANAGRALLERTADKQPDQRLAELEERHRKLSFRANDHQEALAFSSLRRYRGEPGTAGCIETVPKDRNYYAQKGDLQRVRRIDAANAELPGIRAELAEVERELAALQKSENGRSDWTQFSLEA